MVVLVTQTIPELKKRIESHRRSGEAKLDRSLLDLESVANGLLGICDQLMDQVNNPAQMSGVIGEIASERLRQLFSEGYTHEQDDAYVNGELARAAACYSAGYMIKGIHLELHKDKTQKIERFHRWSLWPWPLSQWKAQLTRRMLIKAAALIVAEIERIDRAAKKVLMDAQRPKPYNETIQTAKENRNERPK